MKPGIEWREAPLVSEAPTQGATLRDILTQAFRDRKRIAAVMPEPPAEFSPLAITRSSECC